jgi:hypothetical protein
MFVNPEKNRIYMSWSPYDFNVWVIENEYTTMLGSTAYIVPRGFVTDFTSIPRIFQSILPRWSDYARGALIHDYLYSTHLLSKEASDKVLFDLMTQDNVNVRQKYMIYWAVKWFGGKAWRKGIKK